ncbi:MAG: PH domain-containing protein [Actinomycetota bacterium]
MLAFAEHRKRGILAVTDRRLIHVSHAREERPVVSIPRTEVRSAKVTTGLLGVRLAVELEPGSFTVFDRIRPRSSAREFERLLTPVEDAGA